MTERKKQVPRGESGTLKRLVASVLIFAFCFAARTLFPEQTQGAAELMKQTMEVSSHFEDAFSELGTNLTEGKSLADSVGSWCVTVFAPQEISVSENVQPASDQAAAQTPSKAEQLISWLKSLLHDA